MNIKLAPSLALELEKHFNSLIAFINDGNNLNIVSVEGSEITTDVLETIDFSGANIYVIYSSDKLNGNWKIKYIGQRKKKAIKTRLKNHLLGQSYKAGTKSKIKFIENELSKKSFIAIKLIKIEEDSLRHYFEEKLIEHFKSQPEQELWNNHKDLRS